MQKEKTYYENLIENSILFTQTISPDSILYQRALLKLIENVYGYLNTVSEKNKYYSVEIVETVKECVRNYRCENGTFLHYFNYCLKKKKTRVIAETTISENTKGMHVPRKDRFTIEKHIKFIVAKNRTYEVNQEIVSLIAKATNISENFVRECLCNYRNSHSFISTESLYDDKSLWEYLIITDSSAESMENVAAVKEILFYLNEFFNTRQPRQKPILSRMITAKISMVISDYHELLCFAKHLDFFDCDTFDHFLKTNTVPCAKEIAQQFHVSEQSISRTYRIFSQNAYRYITEKQQTTK